MPHFPSSLEGMWSHKALRWSRKALRGSHKAPNGYRLLNGVNDLGQNQDLHHGVCLSQSEACPSLSLGRSDVVYEHDVILPIKGECMRMLKALGSWHLVSVLETECSVVDWKVGLSLKRLSCCFKQ